MSDAKLVDQGVHAVVPYLIFRNAARAIRFLEAAFGATVVERIDGAEGKVDHAELRIGGGTVFLADEFPDFEDVFGPETLEGTSVILAVEVSDVAAMYGRALAAGAKSIRAPYADERGVRLAKVRDPFGHVWLITVREAGRA